MKQVRKTFKADMDVGGEGRFTALVSTFGTVDSQMEEIEPGAFTEGLKAFSDKHPLPILWDHQWDDIWAHIGTATAEQTKDGLIVEAQLDMENPTAKQAYRLLSQGRVHEFSIGGFEPDESVTADDDGTRHVGRFDLAEVSLTLKGANPDTQLIDIKSRDPDEAKAGRVLAARHVKTLKDVSSELASVKKTLDDLIEEVDIQQDPSDDGDKEEPDASGKSMSARIAAARIALAASAGKGN
jgi:HK97 family phage prohead protease